MNGIESEKKVKILPSEKDKIIKKKLHFKLITCILVSNIFVIILFYSFTSKKEELSNTDKNKYKQTPKGFKRIRLPLKLFVPLLGPKKIPVSIYSKEKELIVKKAYLLPITDEKKGPDISYVEDHYSNTQFTIEVPYKDLKRIIALKDQILMAYPYLDSPFHLKKASRKREQIYEIIF